MFKSIRLLPATLLRKARALSRKLWVRVVVMGLLSIVSLGLTQLIDNFVPTQMASRLSGSAADRLLDLIANAMLAVTIFSMTVMVSVYQSSASQWTPRVHQLIMQDRVTQKTLAAFIGTYLYALVAIILRELGVFVDDHALVLFWMTVLVLTYVVWSLVRWALHLQTFGSLLDTTRQLESQTRHRFQERLDTPCLGANPLAGAVPDDAWEVRARESGYIQHLYPEGLQEAAKRFDVEVYLNHPVGSFIFLNQPLLSVKGEFAPQETDGDEDPMDRDGFEDLLRDHVKIGDLRTYDQDPRFGLTVLGEIGSKALSPGINDPGTAIDVITRIGRILSSYRDETSGDEPPSLDRLWVAPLDPWDLLDDGYGALSRDGAGVLEVQHRLQRTLDGLMRHPDAGLRHAAQDIAERALHRALEAMTFAPDRERLMRAAHPDVRATVSDA
ncbi:DUF2254 domain-containing protein [Rhodobacteraceae bacterium KMM 6894]|nr:DUF2254 domain-containing protein [Rhodobacteraceae bacterium KMM 6894]